MPVFFNFPDINNISWLPVNFKTVGQDYTSKFTPISFKDGIKFGLNSCLENYKDTSFNKKTGFFLTDLTNTSKILEDNLPPEDQQSLTQIQTPIAAVGLPYDVVISLSTSRQLSATYRSASYQNAPTPSFGPEDIFNFVFSKDISHATFEGNLLNDIEEDFVSIETNSSTRTDSTVPDKFLLTWQNDSEALVFRPKIYPDSYSQKFSYLLSEDGICLFKPNSNFYYIVSRDTTNNVFYLKTYNPRADSSLPINSFLKFVSHKKLNFNKQDVTDSHLTKYVVNKLDYQQELIPDPSVSASTYSQNFLGIYPVENPHIQEKSASYDLQIHGLKNYQTPEYNYSFNKNYIEGAQGVHRIYDRIFSGTNQKEGHSNVYLGYTANSTEIVFEKDKETLFSFAPTSFRTPLSSSGLIEDGAIPGHLPYVADRIFLRQIDYSFFDTNIPQPPSITKNTNTWLCSWLSGSNGGQSAWVDRFYNAAYYTSNQALSAEVFAYNDRLQPSKNYIFDVPSTMYLEPGAFYRYHHGGIKTSQNYLPFLDNTINSPLGSKVLHISSWNTDPLTDNSLYANNGLIYSEDNKIQSNTFWDLNGSTHAVFPSKKTLLDEHQFTTSLWLNVKDWTNIIGNQIFGNYYNSGYGLLNETSLTAPILSFVEKTSGQMYNLNYQFKVINYSEIPTNAQTGNLITVRYPDFTYWVFDTNNGTGYKFDIEGRKLGTAGKYFRITQIESDNDLNLYLFHGIKKVVWVLDQDGNIKTPIPISLKSSTKRIEIFEYKNDNPNRPLKSKTSIIEIVGNASVIDNLGNIWQVVGNNLYKTPYNSEYDIHGEPTFFATVGLTQQITCDAYNNIWILHDQDKVSILDTIKGNFLTRRIGKRKGAPEDPCLRTTERFRYINFIKTPLTNSNNCINLEFKDLAVIVDSRDNELIMMDFNGDMIAKLDLFNLTGLKCSSPKYFAEGDFTGYQLLRKFKSNNKNISWKFKITEGNGNNPEYLSLNYDTRLLHPGWHHFAFSFDAEKGKANYYIDSLLVDSKNFAKTKQLWFDYKSSLLLGAMSVKNSNLNDLINIHDTYKFIGQVADLRVYNKTLPQGDIEQIYFSFDYSDDRKPLIWNMSTGKRNYIEEIQHWFQMQLPGNKSKYFNINIHNLQVSDEVKILIENAIRNNISKLAPAYTSLFKINWNDYNYQGNYYGSMQVNDSVGNLQNIPNLRKPGITVIKK
jgi:hypothetical protein